MRPKVIGGIRERSDAFLKKCTESGARSIDAYVRLLFLINRFSLIKKVLLHCFALDCTSHHLFHPQGTRSIEGGADLKLMVEQSYHDSLKGHLPACRHAAQMLTRYQATLLNIAGQLCRPWSKSS